MCSHLLDTQVSSSFLSKSVPCQLALGKGLSSVPVRGYMTGNSAGETLLGAFSANGRTAGHFLLL